MLAKTQNLSDLEENFIQTQFGKTNPTPPVREEFVSEKDYNPDAFSIPADFWSALTADKCVAKEIERIISQEVQKRADQFESKIAEVLKTRLVELEHTQKTLSEQKEKEGYEAGFQKGLQEGNLKSETDYQALKIGLAQEVEVLKNEMRNWIQGFIDEKEKLLNVHQQHWIRALSHLLKKFLVKNSGQIEVGIQKWIETQVVNFRSEEKLKVFIPESQFKSISKLEISAVSPELEFIKDLSLKDNEFRIESSSGGIFFSASEQLNQLETMVEDILKA